jgi:5-methylcytosine-specific restriction endonuclease McrA
MPIRPENKHRYPSNWSEIRQRILKRAGDKCEWCGAVNGGEIQRVQRPYCVVLTIAHLDHTPENCDDDNLRALCQQCHNRYDMPTRAKNRKRRLLKEYYQALEDAGQSDLFKKE